MTTKLVIREDDYQELRRRKYTIAQLKVLNNFMARLCPTAQRYIPPIFVWARRRKHLKTKKPYPARFSTVMKVCRGRWKNVWRHGTSGRFGDPDDVTRKMGRGYRTIGMRNMKAFCRVYGLLHLELPKFLFMS